MKRILQTMALSALIIASASTAQAQSSFGFHIGVPPAPRAYRVPPQPGPDYVWIEGYHYPQGSHYVWHDGYWTRPPYEGAYWVAPYHYNGQYFAGQWEGTHGYVAHDHRWDRGNNERGNNERDNNRYDYNNGSYRDTGTVNSRAQAQATVRAAYLKVLGREPDPGSVGWVDSVFANRLSPQQLEIELRNSPEYRQKHQGGR